MGIAVNWFEGKMMRIAPLEMKDTATQQSVSGPAFNSVAIASPSVHTQASCPL